MKTSNYLEVEVDKGSGIINHRTYEIIGFNCDIYFNCTCGWNSSAWGEFAKGSYSKTCTNCGATKSYKI